MSRRKQPISAPLPLAPGWYVQWAGRSDWQVMDETSARMLQKIIVASGDKVLHVEIDSDTPQKETVMG